MKAKQFKAQKRRVKTLIDKWLRPLGLLWWRTEIAYHDKAAKSKCLPDHELLFSTDAQWQYRQAWIDAYLPRVAEQSDEDLEYQVVHELCHILVAELQTCPDADKQAHTEHVVTALAHAFLWVRDGVQ
jgi:hypothetical protein